MDIESISEFFKVEDDPFYRRGYAKAMNKEVKSIVGRMKKGGHLLLKFQNSPNYLLKK